ncbi:DUF5977 domain-containing protein [Flavobacterium phragmitis]|uniref:Fibronectin type III domain-containing protein n=1 Tax=Flavobacterium phragmitis TaxID=739143 RepID=A0A1I1WH31_9FLAO|nr:DUF5977 domain-containing protein [Flavobacterium phragmitis]SFD94301.1 Fibronectin type III domain-containing protein [Flavobacterium phragmitis]
MEENTTYKPFAYQENYIPAEGETVFYNTEQTLTKTKNDCTTGIPSSVNLTAEANKFVSNESVDEANEQAEAWLKTNSQAYANNTGTCFIDSTPPSTIVLSTSNITPNTVVLSWTEATDNIGVSGYDIYIGDTFLDTTSNDVLSYTVNELSPSTAYSFYIKAKDFAGNSSNSNVLEVNTLPLTLTLKAVKSVIFEKKSTSWSGCKDATSADLQHTDNNVIGGGKDASYFYLNRYRGVIDTSSISARPKSAKIKFKFSQNTVGNALTFNLYGANIQIPVGQNFQLVDWNDWDSSTFINSVSVPVNSTSENEIPLTSSQLDLLLSQQAFNFFLISNGDRNNSDPSTNNRPTLSITPTTGEVYLECEF